MQAVLSAAASRHQAGARSTRSGDKEKEKESAPAAFIPTPDSTGIVHDYEELYPPGRWRDPISYVKSSDTVEEATSYALANGFIYYMDERDQEWLNKNNEQARGEGMSSQAAATSSTRSGRSAKAKGKEPDVVQPVLMTEDEFELVMAIFEKVTHEKTEFLHHVSATSQRDLCLVSTRRQGIEQGAPFPPFSDYQDTFANHLQPDMFAVYSVPEWVPQPPQMYRYARLIYPYWRERRLERGGHRIIPTVNVSVWRIYDAFGRLTPRCSLTKAIPRMSPTSVSGDARSRLSAKLEHRKPRTPTAWYGYRTNSRQRWTSLVSYTSARTANGNRFQRITRSGTSAFPSPISNACILPWARKRTTNCSWTERDRQRNRRPKRTSIALITYPAVH